MVQMVQFDLVVVGSGAGLMILEAAMNRGLKCAIVEKDKFGGTCLTKGCIPSKMLVYPADFIRETEQSFRFGVQASPPRIDWDTISRRMWEQINFHREIETNLKTIPELTVYQGTGSFTGSHTMRIQHNDHRPDEEIYGSYFVVAAGARSYVPPLEGLEETGYVTSETFFGEKFPPKPWNRLAILGGGAISAEFAHIFSAFGTKVTVIARGHQLLNKEEPEIRDFVKAAFQRQGIDVRTDSVIQSVSRDSEGKHITIQNRVTGSAATVACDEIFVASGVRSNADLLSAESAGIALDAPGWIITDSYLQTSQKHIWALGDINGKYQFRHKANYEAQILAENLFGGDEKKEARYDAVPWAVFTHPQVAHVGLTEQQCRDKGIRYAVAKNHYSEVVGGRAMGFTPTDEDNGFVKLIVGENKTILGVHIVGPQAAVLLQPFVYLMNAGHPCGKTLRLGAQAGTYVPINESMVIHPSLSELTAWALEKIDWEDGQPAVPAEELSTV